MNIRNPLDVLEKGLEDGGSRPQPRDASVAKSTTASAITEWALSRKYSSSRAASAIYLHLHSSICFSVILLGDGSDGDDEVEEEEFDDSVSLL